MPMVRASWGGALASKTRDFAGTPVSHPAKSPVRTPWAPGAPALAAAARAVDEVVSSGRSADTAHPAWIVERIAAAWPQACPEILAANNGHPPMTLRLDLSRTDRTAYLIELSRACIDAHEVPWAPAAVTLAHPVAVSRLPGFGEGKVSVQDAGAQLAAPLPDLLDARPGMRVLDACAAPGGKTAHVLEKAGERVEVVAVDIDAG